MSANSKQMDPSVESIERPALFRLTRETVRHVSAERKNGEIWKVSKGTDDRRGKMAARPPSEYPK